MRVYDENTTILSGLKTLNTTLRTVTKYYETKFDCNLWEMKYINL